MNYYSNDNCKVFLKDIMIILQKLTLKQTFVIIYCVDVLFAAKLGTILGTTQGKNAETKRCETFQIHCLTKVCGILRSGPKRVY